VISLVSKYHNLPSVMHLSTHRGISLVKNCTRLLSRSANPSLSYDKKTCIGSFTMER